MVRLHISTVYSTVYCCLLSLLLSLSTLAMLTSAETSNAKASAAMHTATSRPAHPRIAYIHISDVIDEWQAQYIKRAIHDAVAQKADYIITHIDSYGGRVDSAIEILDTYLSLRGPDKPKAIAFIDPKAISAAALIAFGNEEIFMTKASSIGDIGVIFTGSDGEMKYAPEKSITLIRSKLANASAIRGWDAAWLQKMTDRNQSLYQIRHPDGHSDYVIEENLPLYLADNPDINADNPKQVITVLGEDRYATPHAEQAVQLHVATGVVANLAALYTQLGTTQSAAINLSPTDTELIARALAGWAPLLLGLAIIFIILEIKTAGIGIFAVLACVSGTLYAVCQYYQNLANGIEFVLIILGLILIAAELFTMVGGGALILVGILIAFIGIFFSFMPDSNQFDFHSPFYSAYLSTAIINSLLTFTCIGVALILFLFAAPKIPLLQRLAMKGEINSTSANSNDQASIGSIATALSTLRPSGQIQLASGLAHSAQTRHGTYIDAGAQVRIVDQQYGDFIVEIIDPSLATQNDPISTDSNHKVAST